MTDLRQILEALRDTDPKAEVKAEELVVQFVRELIAKADNAWAMTAELGAAGAENCWDRAKAYAYCDVLGDQEALLRMIDR